MVQCWALRGLSVPEGSKLAVPVLPPHMCTKKEISAFVCFSAQTTEGQSSLRGGLEGLSSLWGVQWPMSERTQGPRAAPSGQMQALGRKEVDTGEPCANTMQMACNQCRRGPRR